MVRWSCQMRYGGRREVGSPRRAFRCGQRPMTSSWPTGSGDHRTALFKKAGEPSVSTKAREVFEGLSGDPGARSRCWDWRRWRIIGSSLELRTEVHARVRRVTS